MRNRRGQESGQVWGGWKEMEEAALKNDNLWGRTI